MTALTALPEYETVARAEQYLDDMLSSDPRLERMTAIMLLQDTFALMFCEADAVWSKWSKSKFEVKA